MRVFAKLNIGGNESASYVIPCKNLRGTVQDLKKGILLRQSGDTHIKSQDPSLYNLSLAGSGAVLYGQDIIEDVIQDGDVVLLSKNSTKFNMATCTQDIDCNELRCLYVI